MSLFEDTAWDPKYKVKMGAIGLVVIGCGIALWGGWSDLKFALYSSSEPQTISASQLCAEGPSNNLHVLVTDYQTSPEAMGNGEVAWFIVYPLEHTQGQASMLLKTDGGDALFGVYVPDDGLQGLVRSGNGSLNADQRNRLKKLWQIDFENLWFIDHNRTPPPWWRFLLKVLGGLALVAVGVFIFIVTGDDD